MLDPARPRWSPFRVADAVTRAQGPPGDLFLPGRQAVVCSSKIAGCMVQVAHDRRPGHGRDPRSVWLLQLCISGDFGEQAASPLFPLLFTRGHSTVRITWLDDRIAGLVSNRGCSA